MNGLLLVALALAGCYAAAYVIASVIVVVLDLLGLCWSMAREEKGHADDVPSFNVQARRRFDR